MILQENRKLNEILLKELGKRGEDFFAIGSGDDFMGKAFEFVGGLKKIKLFWFLIRIFGGVILVILQIFRICLI